MKLCSHPTRRSSIQKLTRLGGESGVERIKATERTAALKSAKQRKCDQVDYVGLSDRMSSPPFGVVVFVDCRNKWRFYVDQDDRILITEKRN